MLSLHILLADDDAAYRQNLGLALESRGHRLLQVEDGRQALAVLRVQPVDLLITDYQMPRMDGAVLARAVFALYALPILLCSGSPRLVPDLSGFPVEIFPKSARLALLQRIQDYASEVLPLSRSPSCAN